VSTFAPGSIPSPFVNAEYTDSESQLRNRVANAPLLQFVDAFRTYGHVAARIDPLDLLRRDQVPALDPKRYQLLDPNEKYNVNGIIWTRPIGAAAGDQEEEWWTLEQIVQHLQSTYSGGLAYEFMHSYSTTEALWFAHHLESKICEEHTADKGVGKEIERKKRIHELIARSETFDHFMQLKFPNLKRYGLEGGESLLPALDTLFSVAAFGQFTLF
jgi:probable 2-oxoglutarate dehydrogenase E1 component DHKTD1